MIRQLVQNDHEALMKLVRNESELNLFIIGDVENYGYDSDFQRLWGEFDHDNKLTAVLLRYFSSFIFYSRNSFFAEGFYSIMENEGYKILSGETSIVKPFMSQHIFSKVADTYFCKLNKPVNYSNRSLLEKVVVIDPDDKLDEAVNSLIELYSVIREFNNINAEEIKKKLSDRTGRAYCIYEDNKLVAVAQTTAENSMSAMIVGVCTHPDYRHKGYASACMARLCSDLLSEGKSLCLFYNNPEAGRIYKKLGFEDMGKWSMLYR